MKTQKPEVIMTGNDDTDYETVHVDTTDINIKQQTRVSVPGTLSDSHVTSLRSILLARSQHIDVGDGQDDDNDDDMDIHDHLSSN